MQVTEYNLRMAMQSLTKSKVVIASVYLLLLSYFYNLPVISYSARGSNEFRLYDIVGIVIVVLYFRNTHLLNALIRFNKSLHALFHFMLWSSFMLIFTFINSILNDKLFWGMQSVLYLYHFYVFFLGAVFLIIVIQDMKQLTRMVNFCLICASLTFFVVVLQNFELVPFLWNESYRMNYLGFLSGTLGPNKIVLGMTCLIIFAFCMGLLNDKRVKINKILLLVTVGLSALVIIMSGSRTSYLGLAVFLGYFLIKETKNFVYSSIVLFFLLLGVSSLNPQVLDKAFEVYEGRVENKIRDPNAVSEGNVGEIYEDLGSGRKNLSLLYINYLIENPFVIPFGLGFNNRLELISSAHNIYLSLINEVGVVGVFFYFRWLLSYMGVRMQHFPQLRMALKGLVFSMIVTLFFGEHLYVYRPLFGLLGLFLFITTLLASPVFILNNEDDQTVRH